MNLLISDIVRGVKCEIAEAFAEKVSDPYFYWLKDWSAKVDLTLQVNDQAGISPTASYTKYFRNGFNFDAGSSSLTSTSIQSVQQFFTLSVGGSSQC